MGTDKRYCSSILRYLREELGFETFLLAMWYSVPDILNGRAIAT